MPRFGKKNKVIYTYDVIVAVKWRLREQVRINIVAGGYNPISASQKAAEVVERQLEITAEVTGSTPIKFPSWNLNEQLHQCFGRGMKNYNLRFCLSWKKQAVAYINTTTNARDREDAIKKGLLEFSRELQFVPGQLKRNNDFELTNNI